MLQILSYLTLEVKDKFYRSKSKKFLYISLLWFGGEIISERSSSLDGLFLPADEGGFLSVPDGVLLGVMPPAGNFSRQRKVTKSWLRTNRSKDSFVSYYG